MKSTIALTPCTSHQLAAYGYDAATQTLAITFKQKGGTSLPYHYPCTPELFAELESAESKGKFFNQRIKGNKDMSHTKMVPDDDEQGKTKTDQAQAGAESQQD